VVLEPAEEDPMRRWRAEAGRVLPIRHFHQGRLTDGDFKED
jgi:hypothetical protein